MDTWHNPLEALDEIQTSDRDYVETFQKVGDDTIQAWIYEWISTGRVLWNEPFVQLSEGFQTGRGSQRTRISENHWRYDHHGAAE